MGIIKLPCNIQYVLGSFVQQQTGQADAQVLSSQLGFSWNVPGSNPHQLRIILGAIFLLGEGRRWDLVSRKEEVTGRSVFNPSPSPSSFGTWAVTRMVACMVSCMLSEPSRLQTPPVRYSWQRKQVISAYSERTIRNPGSRRQLEMHRTRHGAPLSACLPTFPCVPAHPS